MNSKEQTSVMKLLLQLCNHKAAWPFLEPVDPVALGVPDYFSIITHPMDLGTIRKKVGSHSYSRIEDVGVDVELVWTNAETYNGPSHDVTKMAHELKAFWDPRFAALLSKLSSVSAKSGGEEDVRPSKKQKLDANSSKVTSSTVSDNQPLTFEEKRRVCLLINSLDPKYLGKVVQILHKVSLSTHRLATGMPDIFAHADQETEEIEINIDALNLATVKELERYAKSFESD